MSNSLVRSLKVFRVPVGRAFSAPAMAHLSYDEIMEVMERRIAPRGRQPANKSIIVENAITAADGEASKLFKALHKGRRLKAPCTEQTTNLFISSLLSGENGVETTFKALQNPDLKLQLSGKAVGDAFLAAAGKAFDKTEESPELISQLHELARSKCVPVSRSYSNACVSSALSVSNYRLAANLVILTWNSSDESPEKRFSRTKHVAFKLLAALHKDESGIEALSSRQARWLLRNVVDKVSSTNSSPGLVSVAASIKPALENYVSKSTTVDSANESLDNEKSDD